MDGFMRALVSVWTDSGFASLTIENIIMILVGLVLLYLACLLYTSPSPRDRQKSRMPSSA